MPKRLSSHWVCLFSASVKIYKRTEKKKREKKKKFQCYFVSTNFIIITDTTDEFMNVNYAVGGRGVGGVGGGLQAVLQ